MTAQTISAIPSAAPSAKAKKQKTASPTKKIVLLPGDGIGPEVTRVAADVLRTCASERGLRLEFTELPFGGAAIDVAGEPLPSSTLKACIAADAILLGACGGPKWDKQPPGQRPESGLLALRKGLGLYINLRPVRLRPALAGISPLRPERAQSIDIEIVRELAGGIYFGEHGEETLDGGIERAWDVETYTTPEIERVARYAFARAEARSRHVSSVDKANVLTSSVLWRRTVTRYAEKHPGVKLDHMYVDNAAMQLVLAPAQFDVILTSNMFGDILSDGAAALVGSIGLIPSMSSGSGPSLYEPIHGSAPTLAGKDVACPIGAILSAAMLLGESLGLADEAAAVDSALERVLERGFRTVDIAEPSSQTVGCARFGELVSQELAAVLREQSSGKAGGA
ncbi:MAG: 3-isopropylmalate dehydrogenase [Candidatus Acidiferrales bacterium]|jgi:3-isopropylmalate dehydrogenase